MIMLSVIQVPGGFRAKSARLLEALSLHPTEKPRTLAWLLSVIEKLYEEVEAKQRRGGDQAVRKLNMPDVTFSYFLQRYGSKSMVDEYVASLVNTLLKHKEVCVVCLSAWLS